MADYTQTHAVPTEGLPAWNQPDGSGPPAANLDPGLDVQLIEQRADWAHIRCSNGWEAWVDGRRLVESVPAPATPAAPPPPPTPAQAAPPPEAAPPPTQPAPEAAPPPTQPAPQAAPPTEPGPPSAAWSAPGAAPSAPRAGGGFRIGPGQIVALVGGFVFFVSSWLTWAKFEASILNRSVSRSYSAYKVPAHFLLDSQSSQSGLGLGILIAFLGVACIAAALLSALRRSLGILPIAAGGVSFVVMVLFFVQMRYLTNALPPQISAGYFSVVQYGAIIAMLGAIATIVGGVLAVAIKRG